MADAALPTWVYVFLLALPPCAILLALTPFIGRKKPPGSGAYDPKTGLGRGAPGFQTNVARIAVPAHIVARIRAGEDVSAEEITRAQDEARRAAEKEAEASAREAAKGTKRKGKKK